MLQIQYSMKYTWTGLAAGRVNQNDRDKWRKYIHRVANPRIKDG